MYDIHVVLSTAPGALAALGTLLGKSGIGLEGGGLFATPEGGHAHFLVEEGERAREVLLAAGFNVQGVRRPLIRKLPQLRPGELGEIAEAIARSGVTIQVQYSDHRNRLILLTDDDLRAGEATRQWDTAPE